MTPTHDAALDPSSTIGFVVDRAGVKEAWHEICHRTDDPAALVDSLASAGLGTEALRCIAVAIPSRQCIWWGWVSARHAIAAAAAEGAAESPRIEELLSLVEQWIAAPEDGTRRQIWSKAQAIGIKHPVTLAAAALWFSGGSIAEADGADQVPAPPGMVAIFVSAAVTVSTLQGPPDQMDARLRASIAQGLEIVHKLGGWPTSIAYVRQESGSPPSQET